MTIAALLNLSMTEKERDDLAWVRDLNTEIGKLLETPVLRLTAFLDEEEQRCKWKIRTNEESSSVSRCAQSRLHLIEKVREIVCEN